MIMHNNNLTIDLKSKKDQHGNTFYIGKLRSPVLIDASKGIAFLVFTSESGSEQLQIAPMIDRNGEFDHENADD